VHGRKPEVVTVTDSDRRARVALSFVADSGDVVLGAALRTLTATEILAAIKGSDADGKAVLTGASQGHDVRGSLEKWRNGMSLIPSVAALAAWEEIGMRLIVPGDSEWPTQLDDLGDAVPLVLWLRGAADLRFACLRSVSVVGSCAASAYGLDVALHLAAELAENGFTVISGGAYGIDTGAHRGAIAVGGCTVAVLGSGLSYSYLQGQHGLFEAIAEHGALVSECPPSSLRLGRAS
jgi:DNA processing protein